MINYIKISRGYVLKFFIYFESENSEQESKMKIGKIVEDFENNQQMGPNIILLKVEQGYDEDA